MLAMQYTIQLPGGYDMGRIRDRVEDRIALFESLPGLAHKSYLVNDSDEIYAPFYIWDDIAEARRFMLHDLFKGVIQSFSRPRIRTWTVIDRVYGNRDITPTFAVREADIIPMEESLEKMVAREVKAQAKLLENDHLHFHAIAIDPDRWELMRYSLWKDQKSAEPQAADVVQFYEVLHVSEPGQNLAVVSD